MAEKTIKEMSFLDHLEELRWVLVRCSAGILVMGIVAYFFADYIFDTIIFGPTKTDFITYRFFCDASNYLGFAENICVTELPFKIINTQMEGQVNIFVWICIMGGFILAFPYILYQFWKFISPALYEKEKKNATLFISVASILFFLGVTFGYFVIVPMSVNFLATFHISSVVENNFTIDSYISMVKTSVIACGLFFELPIIIYFLTKLGLVTPTFLRNNRKYTIVIVLIVAAIITPPDVISQITVSIPMLIIYEASILISAIVVKNKLKNEPAS